MLVHRIWEEEEGTITSRRSMYEPPRFVVRDWDADTFARRLRSWYG